MTRLFAADVETAFLHAFEDITVAYFRTFESETEPLQIPLQPQVRHDRRHHAATTKAASFVQSLGDQRHQLIAIDGLTRFIDHDQAVGIPVQCQTDIGAGFAHLGLDRIE